MAQTNVVRAKPRTGGLMLANGKTMPAGAAGGPGWTDSVGFPGQTANGWGQTPPASGANPGWSAAEQPVQISTGVWVYPDGTQLTGAQIAAATNASTVEPASATQAELAAEAAAASVAVTPAPVASTSFFDESTLFPPYTNGTVVGVGAGLVVLAYLFTRKR